MRRFFLMMAALLLCGSAAFAQYTNLLENATTQTVTTAWTNDSVWVGQNTSGNVMNVVSGGSVYSTNVYVGATSNANDNAVSVTGSGSWNIADTLQIGSGTNNSVSVGDGGTISVGNLSIDSGNTFDLNSNGTFAISTNFDASMNGFNWNSGGSLSVGGTLTGMAVTNDNYYLDGGRNLTLDGGSWDVGTTNLVVGYGGSESKLVIKSGGFLQSGTTYVGWDTNSANNSVTVRDGSSWQNSGDLWLGVGGSGNGLWLIDGGTNVVNGSAYIGNTNTANNYAIVKGTNSFWDIGGNLTIGGTGTNSTANYLSVSDTAQVSVGHDLTLNSGNSLSLASGGALSVGGDMNIYSNSSISGTGTISFGTNDALLAFIGDGISVSNGIVFQADSNAYNRVSVTDGTFDVAGSNAQQYVNFSELDLQNSDLTGTGAIDAFNDINMQGGTINPGGDSFGTLTIPGSFSSSGTVYNAQIFKSGWDQLVFSGTNQVDLSGLDAEVVVASASTNTMTILSANSLTNSFYTNNVSDRLLLYSASLRVTNNEVQVVLTPDNNLGSTLEFAATESVRAGFSGMKNLVFTRTKQLRRNLVSTQHAIPNEVYLLTNTNAPSGAMGPGDQNTIFDMHVWMQQYDGQGDYNATAGSNPFSLNNSGTTIGADRLIGDSLLVGFNYTYARSWLRTASNDHLDAATYWLGAYSEWVGVDGLYVDALAGVGRSNYDTERYVGETYHGTSSFHGNAAGAYADIGQYYYYGNNLAISPYMGLHALSLVVNGHQETEDAGSTVNVGDVTRNWLESAIGLKLRHRFDTSIGRFQTTGYAEWTYDYLQDNVSATMSSDGLGATQTARVSPDASTINVGLGYSWNCTDYMDIGVGYNGRFSKNFEEHTGSLMLDIMF